MEWISAPEILSGRATKSSKSTSSDKFIFEVIVENTKRWINISHLYDSWSHDMTHTFWRRSGSGNSIFLSRRPGRRRAGSKVSCLLVAMMTLTFTDWSKPSIWFKSSRRIRWTSRSAPVWASKRFVAIASISSMKIIDGEFSVKSFQTDSDWITISSNEIQVLKDKIYSWTESRVKWTVPGDESGRCNPWSKWSFILTIQKDGSFLIKRPFIFRY